MISDLRDENPDTMETDQQPFTSPDRKHLIFGTALVFFATLFLYSIPFVDRPFSSRGESRESLVVKDMITQQNFILPLRNGSEIPSKPPLFHWMAVGAGKIFGELSEYSLRFPSALSAAIVGAGLFAVAYQMFGLSVALMALLILTTGLEWMRTATIARVDLVFSAATNLALLFGALWVEAIRSRKHAARFIVPFGVALGLSILAKGPAGFALPVSALGALAVLRWRKGFPSIVQISTHLAGVVLLALGIGGLWYYKAYQLGGERFLDTQLFQENVARLAHVDGYEVGHEKGFYYSVVDLFLAFLPWSLLVPLLVIHRQRLSEIDLWRPAILLSILWSGLLFLAITISASKRPVYFLPAFPSLALLMAIALTALSREVRVGPPLRWFVGALGLLIVFLPAIIMLPSIRGLFLLGEKSPAVFAVGQNLLDYFDHTYFFRAGVLLAGGVLFFGARRARDMLTLCSSVGIGIVILFFVTSRTIAPAFSRLTTPREFVAAFPPYVGASRVFQYKAEVYPALIYLPSSAPVIMSAEDLPIGESVFVLAREKHAAELMTLFTSAAQVLRSQTPAAEGKDYLVLIQGRR